MIEELIKFLGGSVILIGAVAWLIRSLVTHQLSMDIEKLKIKLKHDAEIEIQKISHELSLSSIEHEHKIASLQEKRAEVIAELYKLLVRLVGSAQSYASYLEYSSEPNKDEKAKILGEDANNFRDYFLDNRIYFPNEICTDIDELWENIISPAKHFGFWRNNTDTLDGQRKADEAWDKAVDSLNEKVAPLLRKIANEFRLILGVR